MKLVQYTLIKKNKIVEYQQLTETQKSDILAASRFVKEIEKGNLEVRYSEDEKTLNDQILASSLISMRDQMQKFALDETERKWVTEGMAQFVDILRSKTDNIAELSDQIIRHLVNYMKANQGALYLVNDDNPDDLFIEMLACYAYNRKKHLNHRIDLGQGLAGQVVLEKSTLYMRDIPKDYIKITSGLGEALPRNLVIVPLKLDEKVFGVVELATFHEIKPHQIQFVEKLGESIASTISSVKVNDRTKKLLAETQIQAEQMRAQEEEMRQNMEELSATQEEMRRVQKETEKLLNESKNQETYFIDLVNGTEDSILTVNKHYEVVMVNQSTRRIFGANGVPMEPGFNVMKLAGGQIADFKKPYESAFAGKSVTVQKNYFGREYLVTYNPLKNASGVIIGVSLFTHDITERVEMQALADRRTQDMERNRQVLTKLTKSANVQNGNITEALEEITKTLGEVLGVTRSAVWSYQSTALSIILEKQYLSEEGKFLAGGEFFQKDIPTYFKSVEDEEIIIATDASAHASLIEFKSGYLDVLDIRSMLDVPFFLDGKVGGVICCEHQGETKLWTEEEVDFAKSIADIITIAFKSSSARQSLRDSQQRLEEVRAQEEELRQNMEEMQAIQEELARKNNEMEEFRRVEKERADSQIQAQKKIMTQVVEKFKLQEENYKRQIGDLQNRLSSMEVES